MSPNLSYATINGVRLSAGSDPGVEHPLGVVLEAIAKAGFGWVSLDLWSIDDFVGAPGGGLDGLVAELRALGLRCGDLSAIRISNETDDDAQVARVLTVADAVRPAHCVTTVDIEPDAVAVARLRRCADALAELDVRVALEPLPYCRVSHLQDAISLCNAVGWARCGLTIDTWHMLHGSGTADSLRALDPEMVGVVQVSDPSPGAPADLQTASRHARALPGNASRPLLRALRTAGFDGLMSVEVLSTHWRTAGPTALAEAAIEAANQLL